MKSGIVVGFTGTRIGMTPEQQHWVARILGTIDPIEAHHGDCLGADVEFHYFCRCCEVQKIVIHPPSNDGWRADCQDGPVEILKPKDYLSRNHDIVRACTYLIAAPKEEKEKRIGSGTWATVRYARLFGVTRTIVLPSGRIVME